jgi:hypothetical protein
MKNRSIHPAEFAGWRPSMVDAALWETILWASTDDNGEPLDRNHDLSAAWREDIQALSDQFYAWRDLADGCLLEYGLGELSLEDLLGDRIEHTYVLVRDGHGVSMTDCWNPGIEHDCLETMQELARAQGPIGAYAGDGGRVYLSWSY